MDEQRKQSNAQPYCHCMSLRPFFRIRFWDTSATALCCSCLYGLPKILYGRNAKGHKRCGARKVCGFQTKILNFLHRGTVGWFAGRIVSIDLASRGPLFHVDCLFPHASKVQNLNLRNDTAMILCFFRMNAGV